MMTTSTIQAHISSRDVTFIQSEILKFLTVASFGDHTGKLFFLFINHHELLRDIVFLFLWGTKLDLLLEALLEYLIVVVNGVGRVFNEEPIG